MSSDTHLVLILDNILFAAALSGTNISIISKAYQLFGGTVNALAHDFSNLVGDEMLQFQFEDDGIASASPLPCSSTELILGETAVLFSPKLQIMIRKWYQTIPKPPGSQLHLSNKFLEKVIDESAVFTLGKIENTTLAGKTMIVDDASLSIYFYEGWQRIKEQEPNQEGLPFGGTTHETVVVGSSFTYSFMGVWLLFDLRCLRLNFGDIQVTPPQYMASSLGRTLEF